MYKKINFIFTDQYNNYFLPNGLTDVLVENYKNHAELLNLSIIDYFKSTNCDVHSIKEASLKFNKRLYLHYTRDLYSNVLNNFNKVDDFNYEFIIDEITYHIELKHIDNININEENYYIINLIGNEDFLFSNIQPNVLGENEIFDLENDFNINKKVIKLLSENNIKLAIITFHEGGVSYNGFLDKVFYNIEKYNIPSKNIFYANADAYINQNYRKYCEKNNIKNNINVFNTMHLLHHAAEAFSREERDFDKKKKYFIENINYKDKNFLCLNRTADKSHKLWLLSELYKYNILDSTYYSIIKNKIDEYSYKHNSNFNELMSNEKYNEQLPYLNAIKNKGSVTITQEINSNKFNLEDFTNPYNNNNSFLYMDTYLSIVVESTYLSTQISEKTAKALMYFHPFIVVSGPGYLKRLKELGFKTFSQWWDESYDDEENPEKRMEKIINVINELNDKEKLHKIYLESKDIVLHNSSLFKELKVNNDLKHLFNWLFTC
jgi:hypothetical protein